MYLHSLNNSLFIVGILWRIQTIWTAVERKEIASLFVFNFVCFYKSEGVVCMYSVFFNSKTSK